MEHLRRIRGDELVKPARCLHLVTHAVIVWNTVDMAEAVAQRKQEVSPVHESDLAPIWPPGMHTSMSMAAITAPLRRHGDGRAYDRYGHRVSTGLHPHNVAMPLGTPKRRRLLTRARLLLTVLRSACATTWR